MSAEAKKRVLIIDDSQSLRNILHEALEVLRFEVSEAEGAEAALASVQAHLPDLIILDWHMPGMDGYELFLKLRDNPQTAEIPVIMLTAEDRKDSMLKAIRAGVRYYLTKPFTHEDLLTRVVQVLKLDLP
ncbi:MAG: response regulator [bacterium]|nr:response regulator [bacterium]